MLIRHQHRQKPWIMTNSARTSWNQFFNLKIAKFPQEREGSLMAKSLSPSAKTKHSWTIHIWYPRPLKLWTKFPIFKLLFWFKLQQIMQISHILPRIPQITQNPLQNSSTLTPYFQISDHQQRTPGNWSKSPRFRAFCPQFPWTMQNLLNLHPWPAI